MFVPKQIAHVFMRFWVSGELMCSLLFVCVQVLLRGYVACYVKLKVQAAFLGE